MQKLLAKLLVILMILQIISPMSLIGEVFAISNSWDFSVSSDYTFSDTDINKIRIENNLVKLPYNLEHLGAITDTSLDGARRVLVNDNYAYVSANNIDKLIVLDISNPNNPNIVFSLSNGDQSINLDSPMGIAISGKYLYLAGRTSDNISIIDISDPTNLTYIGEIADGGLGQLNGANDIKIVNNKMYITSYVDDAFNIYDISDPVNPQYLGHIKDGTRLNGANRSIINGNYAYIVNDRNDSFVILDISDSTNISIVGEVINGDNGALLNGARGLSISGDYAYISSNVSDSLEIINISDPTNPTHSSSITKGGDIKLDANRANVFYNNFSFNVARSSDAVEIIDISDPINPIHESAILKSSEILIDGANDIVNSGNIFYVASNIGDSLEILKAKYSDNNPYIIPNNSFDYVGTVSSFSEVLGNNNEGNITYQISFDAGNTWYWFDGNTWILTTSGVENSTSASVINSNLNTFNNLNSSSSGNFLFKAFLNSDGTQKVELDSVNIEITEENINDITDIPNKVFWFDGQDTDGDGDSSNEPLDLSELTPFVDKFNGYNSYNNSTGTIPKYNIGKINSFPSLKFDGIDDNYLIDNQVEINTSDYYEKVLAMVFKTGDDVNTFQNIYEQGGSVRGYTIQIENNHLYAGIFNSVEWATGDQYKFVDLGIINTNEIYNLIMLQESTNSKTLKVYLDGKLIGELNNVDYQRPHSGGIGLGFVNGKTIKASDNSSTTGPAYFKGNIGEFISWNYALDNAETDVLNEYFRKKWNLDKVIPVISSSSISSGSILPGSNHNISFTYSDSSEYGTGVGIDTQSGGVLKLEKWDSSNSSWLDVSNLIGTGTLTQTGATYILENLDYGKYRSIFNISDNNGNKSQDYITTFYIDKPSLVISTGSVNIGELNENSNTFGDTLTVTVKTIGAGFRVKLKKNKTLTHSNNSNFIPYYDGTVGMGYDKNNNGILNDYNDDTILEKAKNINTDGNLNTYTYTLKMGAIINKLQASGNYEGKIDFGIELDY